MMKMLEKTDNESLTLCLEGSLDENTSPQVETRIDDIFDSDTRDLRLDLSNVQYISSIGIRLLILSHKRAVKIGKRVVIDDMSDKVKDVLETVGVLPLFSSKDER
ncbi:MAG: anti-sigma factor antagonist [Candidatus Omnitrophica bacterium]|nr:anti-sigma factor antagonist [Candidatus Omnitrophota bacterium]